MGAQKKVIGTVQKVDTSFLVDEKVIVRFIPKVSKDIRDPAHIAYGGKLDGCSDYIAPPRLRKDKLKNILTIKEKEGLEFLMGRDLSIYSDFWRGYREDSLFPIALGKEDVILDKSVPEQYIIWKVLYNNESLIANSKEDLRKRGSYKYVLISEEQGINEDDERVNLKAEAYGIFTSIQDSSPKMRFVLRQFGKHTSVNQKIKFLRGEIGKEIEKNAQVFIKIASDKNLNIKVLIQEGLELGVLRKSKNLYYTIEGKPLCDEGLEPTIDNSSKFLSSNLGQETRLAIEARIKNARD